MAVWGDRPGVRRADSRQPRKGRVPAGRWGKLSGKLLGRHHVWGVDALNGEVVELRRRGRGVAYQSVRWTRQLDTEPRVAAGSSGECTSAAPRTPPSKVPNFAAAAPTGVNTPRKDRSDFRRAVTVAVVRAGWRMRKRRRAPPRSGRLFASSPGPPLSVEKMVTELLYISERACSAPVISPTASSMAAIMPL
eukprot:SAG31_NODE_748_length_12390_cov_6.306484_5_plen_192_part_00